MTKVKTLEIRNLHVSVEDKEILKGIDLTVNENEVHALMGPNGNGKSTLLAAIMGNPKYTVTEGTITYDGKDVLSMPVNERSVAGLFLAMQYPQEIPGVTNSDFLRAAMNVRSEQPVSLFRFIKAMESTINELQMKEDLAHRFLNEGFSGGEKKKAEIFQLLMLSPKLAILDETDSGLDVDAVKTVGAGIRAFREQGGTLLIITHSTRLLDSLEVDKTHILADGRIVTTGDRSLVDEVNTNGFESFIS